MYACNSTSTKFSWFCFIPCYIGNSDSVTYSGVCFYLGHSQQWFVYTELGFQGILSLRHNSGKEKPNFCLLLMLLSALNIESVCLEFSVYGVNII